VASLSQGRTAAAQCGLFTHKSVPVIFEPPCIMLVVTGSLSQENSLVDKYLIVMPCIELCSLSLWSISDSFEITVLHNIANLH